MFNLINKIISGLNIIIKKIINISYATIAGIVKVSVYIQNCIISLLKYIKRIIASIANKSLKLYLSVEVAIINVIKYLVEFSIKFRWGFLIIAIVCLSYKLFGLRVFLCTLLFFGIAAYLGKDGIEKEEEKWNNWINKINNKIETPLRYSIRFIFTLLLIFITFSSIYASINYLYIYKEKKAQQYMLKKQEPEEEKRRQGLEIEQREKETIAQKQKQERLQKEREEEKRRQGLEIEQREKETIARKQKQERLQKEREEAERIQKNQMIVRNSMDKNDNYMLSQVLDKNQTNKSASWENRLSGNVYTVTPNRTYYNGNNPCRDYRIKATIKGHIYNVADTACRQ